MRARVLLVGVAAAAWMSEVTAQVAAPARLLQTVWGAPAHCPATLDALNRALAQPAADDLLAIGRQFDSGECVSRDEAQASQFYAQAARRGNSSAARRLAALFGAGRGVPQSYANAGAWLSGKGDTDEGIEPWDYSVGLAFTHIAAVLERLRFPQAGWPAGLELRLALDADSRQPGRVRWRFTGDVSAQAEALRGPLGEAVDAAAAALTQLAPADPKYLVSARVTLPITVRRTGDATYVVTEQDLLVR
jgi:hypothetical protein